MIYIDSAKGSAELEPLVRAHGVQCEVTKLPFGDFYFEGNGPDGKVAIGIERKALHDMLDCIDSARFSAHQLVGMRAAFDVSVLLVEGHWKPHIEAGFLMEGFHGGNTWGYCRPGGQRLMYNKLYRYLISVGLSGVIITQSRDQAHTAFNVVEWFHYFQKPWEGHTSLLGMQKVTIPTLSGKPPLVRRWAREIEGVGDKLSDLAAKQFRTPVRLATSDEQQWLKIEGIGVKTAQDIVRQIGGYKR